jgi:hypothetical protein
VLTLVAQLSEQPHSVHEVHGSIPDIMKLFHYVLCWYIHMMNTAITSKTSTYNVCLQIIQNIHSILCSYGVCTLYVPVLNMFMKAAKIAFLHQTTDILAAAHTHHIHMTSSSKILCPMMYI